MGEALDSDSKRVRVDSESQPGAARDTENGGAAQGFGRSLVDTPDDEGARSNAVRPADVEPEADQRLGNPDADFERELMESLAGADGLLDGAEAEGTGRGNEREDKDGAEGNGLEDGGLGGNGGMFSFTGLEGVELNDNAFDFGEGEPVAPTKDDERGEENVETMPWDL